MAQVVRNFRLAPPDSLPLDQIFQMFEYIDLQLLSYVRDSNVWLDPLESYPVAAFQAQPFAGFGWSGDVKAEVFDDGAYFSDLIGV